MNPRLAVPTVVSGAAQTARDTEDASVLEPRVVVQRYLAEVLVGGDPTATDSLIASDPFRQRVLAFRRAFPDLAVDTVLLISEGDLIAVRATGRGTHLGPFQGIAPTRRSWTATCSSFYRVEAGAIVEAWVNWDLLAILEQIGGVHRLEPASA